MGVRVRKKAWLMGDGRGRGGGEGRGERPRNDLIF